MVGGKLGGEMSDALWTNGPTQEFVDAKKVEYGQVFKAEAAGEFYIYRLLKRPEFKEFQKTLTPKMTPQGPVVDQSESLEMEDKIAKLCVLWPENYDSSTVPAGVPSLLASFISEASGFVPVSQPEML